MNTYVLLGWLQKIPGVGSHKKELKEKKNMSYLRSSYANTPKNPGFQGDSGFRQTPADDTNTTPQVIMAIKAFHFDVFSKQ